MDRKIGDELESDVSDEIVEGVKGEVGGKVLFI